MRMIGALYPAVSRSKVVIGEIASWSVRSSRDRDVLWTVTLYPDGHWECNCEAGQYGSRADGGCRHIDEKRQEWDKDLDLDLDLAPAA